jgi:hypothetical protein
MRAFVEFAMEWWKWIRKLSSSVSLLEWANFIRLLYLCPMMRDFELVSASSSPMQVLDEPICELFVPLQKIIDVKAKLETTRERQ